MSRAVRGYPRTIPNVLDDDRSNCPRHLQPKTEIRLEMSRIRIHRTPEYLGGDESGRDEGVVGIFGL